MKRSRRRRVQESREGGQGIMAVGGRGKVRSGGEGRAPQQPFP